MCGNVTEDNNDDIAFYEVWGTVGSYLTEFIWIRSYGVWNKVCQEGFNNLFMQSESPDLTILSLVSCVLWFSACDLFSVPLDGDIPH